jgi:hypothetical protein
MRTQKESCAGADGPRFLKLADAARRCSLSVKSLQRLAKAGKLTILRPVGRRALIEASELDRLILASTHQ